MLTPRDFLDVLENEDKPPITIDDRGGALLFHLLVHMFFADGKLDESELSVLTRLVGSSDGAVLKDQVEELRGIPMSYDELAKTFPERRDRLDIITLAEHGFWADNRIEFSEMDVMDKLAEVLEITER